MGRILHEADYSEESLSAPEDRVRDVFFPDHILTYSDMTTIAADIKETVSTATTDLKADLLVLTEKLASTERAEKLKDKSNSMHGAYH